MYQLWLFFDKNTKLVILIIDHVISHFYYEFPPNLALSKQDLHTVLNVPTTDDHIVTQNNSVRSGSTEKTIPELPEHHHHKVNFHKLSEVNSEKNLRLRKISPFF